MCSLAELANLLATRSGFWKMGTPRCQTKRGVSAARPFAHGPRALMSDANRNVFRYAGPEVGSEEVGSSVRRQPPSVQDFSCLPYSTFSATHLDTAVTHFRGANLTDSATSQFRTPEITTVFPAINPR